jgi:hypothetical protein
VLFGWNRVQEAEGGFGGGGGGVQENNNGNDDGDADDDDFLPCAPVLELSLPGLVTVVLSDGVTEVEGRLKGTSADLVSAADNFVFRNQGIS